MVLSRQHAVSSDARSFHQRPGFSFGAKTSHTTLLCGFVINSYDAGISSLVYAPNTSNQKGAVIMGRSLVLSAALTFLVAGSAMAADMPLKAAPRVAPVASDWTGFYIFGFGGYSWGRISPDDFPISEFGSSF